MTGEELKTEGQAETKRDRVRRLLIVPLSDGLGFRKPGNRKQAEHQADLDRICDELAYMSDEGFARLCEAMRGRGDGKARDAWPPVARVISLAEVIEPRPIDELPAMLRWFRSEAGKRATESGRLVAEYDFWVRHKHPPVTFSQQRFVAEQAAQDARRGELIADRRRRGIADDPAEVAWERGFMDKARRVRALIAGGAA